MVKFFSRYLNQLIVLPSIVIALVTLISLLSNISTYSTASQNQLLVAYVKVSMDLVHELQKERGMSAGFLGSGGKNFSSELRQQRSLSDQRFSDFKQFVQQGDGTQLDDGVLRIARGIIQELNGLSGLRSRVDGLNIQLGNALAFYTSQITLLIHEPVALLALIEEKHLIQDVIATFTFAQIKERGGIQRAVFSNILAGQSFSEGNKQRVYSLISAETAYVDAAKSLALPALVQQFERFETGSANKDVENTRKRIINEATQGQFTLSPENWFSLSTRRLGELRKLEVAAMNDMDEYMSRVSSNAVTQLLLNVIFMLVIVVFTLFMFSTVRNIKAQGRLIERTIRNIENDNDLTKRIEVISNDSLGKSAAIVNHLLQKLATDFSKIASYTQTTSRYSPSAGE